MKTPVSCNNATKGIAVFSHASILYFVNLSAFYNTKVSITDVAYIIPLTPVLALGRFVSDWLCLPFPGYYRELWSCHPCPQHLSANRWCNLQEQKNDAGHAGCRVVRNQNSCLQQGSQVQPGTYYSCKLYKICLMRKVSVWL